MSTIVQRSESLLSNMGAQVFVVFHNSFEEQTGLLYDDWLNLLDRFILTKESGNMPAICSETRAIADKNQCFVVPNQFSPHLKDRAIGIDRARLVELLHDGGRVKEN